jgi:F-box protein 9
MADESELQRFRQQWKEEVTKRAQGRPAPSTSTSAAARPTQRPRPPSFSQTRPTRVIAGEDEDEFLPELSSSSKTATSPPPPRQPSFSISGTPKSALEHYEQAVEKESEGNLGESLRLYRKAFRLDDAVDKVYREKYFPKPKPGDEQKEKAVAATTAAVSVVQPSSMSDLVASFAGLKIEPTTEPTLAQEEEEEKKQFSLLAAVPSEILLHILHDLALTDISTFVRLSQVCKHLSYLVATEDSIWRAVSKHAFSRQVWDWRVTVTGHPINPTILDPEDPDFSEEEEDEVPRVAPIDEDELLRYNGSWREMFHLRPRLRYNGIYISTCNYHRSGGHSGMSLSWNTPMHIVTYYRYLRFYPDGTLLSLLTTAEPAEVVYGLSKPSLTPAHLGGLPAASTLHWAPHVARGRWRVDAEGRVDVETEAPNLPRYLFRMQLRIKNVRATRSSVRGAVKLQWEGFWSWNKLTDDLAVFEGRNDKPFFFSRVGAVEKEMEGLV